MLAESSNVPLKGTDMDLIQAMSKKTDGPTRIDEANPNQITHIKGSRKNPQAK